jgi:hypothetical protein
MAGHRQDAGFEKWQACAGTFIECNSWLNPAVPHHQLRWLLPCTNRIERVRHPLSGSLDQLCCPDTERFQRGSYRSLKPQVSLRAFHTRGAFSNNSASLSLFRFRSPRVFPHNGRREGWERRSGQRVGGGRTSVPDIAVLWEMLPAVEAGLIEALRSHRVRDNRPEPGQHVR